MATIHRLNSDWTLTDGIIDPIRLDRPRTIYDALRRENLIPDAHYGMNSLACEWIYNRAFIYEKKFDLPPSNDTERTELHFEHMYGECIVEVNGQRPVHVADGRYDITAAVRNTDNTLQVIVPASGFRGGRLNPTGISGAVSVTGTNRITVLESEFSAAGELICRLKIDAHISGKYHFTCVISREGEALATHEAHKRLIAAGQEITLNFPLPDHAVGTYDILLTIELNGLLCDRLRDSVCIAPAREAEAVCQVDCGADAEDALLAVLPALKSAGFDSIALRNPAHMTRRIATRLQELGLNIAEPAAGCEFCGCMDADTLRKYADGHRCWPTDAPIWKIRGEDRLLDLTLADHFGSIPAKDPDRMTAAIRLHQAQQVFSGIVRARMAGETVRLNTAIDSFPRLASTSLFDGNIPRPALYAAKQALQPLMAAADIPQGTLPCGEVLKFPILLLSRRDAKPLPVTVTATMYTAEGVILSGTSFAAFPGGEMRLGELNCELPRGLRHALLRLTVELPGQENVITDYWLACGDEPMAPAALPRTIIADGKNGDALAYGVVTESGIRCLLPGETCKGFTGEYLNR